MPVRRSVADFVESEALAERATPANLRLGREIAAGGGVEFVEFEPSHVVAKVMGGQRRTVRLDAVGARLRYACSCTTRPDLFCKPGLFCKHSVAAAIVTFAEARQSSARGRA
jgi:uncharacterized Zn finger protein